MAATIPFTNSSMEFNAFLNQSMKNVLRINQVSVWALILANVATMPFTITLNALVIVCISRTERLRERNSNVLLASLAVTDLLVGAMAQPLQLGGLICVNFCGCSMSFLEPTQFAPGVFLMFASILHLDILAVERYINIKHALSYETIVTSNKLKTAIIAAWICSVCLSLSVILGLDHETRDTLYACFLIIFVVVIVFCYVALFRESWRHKKMIHAQLGPDQSSSRNSEFKAMHTTALVVGSVLLFYGVIILSMVVLHALHVRKMTRIVSCLWLFFLQSVNSLVNPLIYFWRVDHLRGAVKKSLKCFSFGWVGQDENIAEKWKTCFFVT